MGKGIRTKVRITGLDDLKRFINELPNRAKKRAMRAAVTAGSTPVTKAIRQRAPKQSGALRKAITKKIKTYSSGNAVAIIGANRETVGSYRGRKRVPSKYIHLVAHGTRPHRQGKHKHPGASPDDFMRAGYESAKGQAQSAMEKKLREVVNNEAAKLKGKV